MRRARQRCITCRPSDWQAIQDLAQVAGMKTSPFILSRVLGGANRMALSAEEQRNLHDRVNRLVLVCEDLLRPLPGSDVTLGEAVAFLYRDRQAAQEAGKARRDAGVQRGLPGLGGGRGVMRAPRERAVSHSLSCTALDWERIRDLAERSGKPMSRFVVDRVLGRDGSGDAEADRGDALVLDETQQRAMHDAALRAEALIERLVAGPDDEAPDLAGSVRMLFEARLDEMARTGRHEAMRALLASTVGPERAARIVGKVLDRLRAGR